MVFNLVKDTDIEWLASAIDCDGTISANWGTNRVQVAVYNTNYEFAKRAADLMGTKIHPLKYKVKDETRIIFSAHTGNRMTILKILKQIESHLIIKRQKAIECIRGILDFYDIADIELRAYPSLP
jgi:hypothetical protein